MKYNPHKSSILDLDANIVALLLYLVPLLLSLMNSFFESIAFLIPLLIFFMEKKSDFVINHASNALAFFAINCILSIISTVIKLPLMLSSWISNVFIFGFFYNGLAIVYALIGLVFALISVALFICEVYSLFKGYRYEEVNIPGINRVASFIKTLRR